MDIHAATTLISALSLRRQHPQGRILLAADEESVGNLERHQHPLLKKVDDVLAVPVPSGCPSLRNRHVKTRLPKLVRGDFLYLDGDTVILQPLGEIFQARAPFAAVPNHNNDGTIERAFEYELQTFITEGWKVRQSPYVNGGVLFFRDCSEASDLSDLWHRKWLVASRRGKHFDQPALNSALYDSGIVCELLPHRFNAQVQVRPRTALRANLWHIYASLPGDLAPRTGLDQLVENFLRLGAVDSRELDAFCGRSHPWLAHSVLDKIVIKSMLKRWDFLPVTCFERVWLAGRRRVAICNLAKKVCRKMQRAASSESEIAKAENNTSS
jgi:hypothetical protein